MRFTFGDRYVEFRRVPLWRRPYTLLIVCLMIVVGIETALGAFWGTVFTTILAVLILKYLRSCVARFLAGLMLIGTAERLILNAADHMGNYIFLVLALIVLAGIAYYRRRWIRQWFGNRG